jgi:hypothetical protein
MKSWMIAVLLCGLVWGCVGEGESAPLPNSDPQLRKTSAQRAADAARRNYENDAARGGQASARAQYNLMSRNFDFVNLSDEDWPRVEVWVNQKYVLFVPIMEAGKTKRLDFEAFYDQNGHHFDTEDGKNPLQTLEIYHDGKIFTVPAVLE